MSDEVFMTATWFLRLSSLTTLLVAPRAVAQRPAADAALAARVDALVRPEASAELLGGVILIARGDRVVLQRAYGFANWELRVPNAPSTRFGVGSITKPMTEALVDQLVREGRLDLDAPVAKYLPGFPSGPRGGQPTVRDLLTHRAGVPHRVTTAVEETQHLHPADIVERVRARGLLFEPGTQELYSSAGFTCLARVVEVVEQKPFDSVLAERVFRPASMAAATGETGQELMAARAMPYRLGAGAGRVEVASAPYRDLSFLTGAGSVYATAADLLHFVRAARGGVLGEAARASLVGGDSTGWHGWYGRTDGYEASVDYLPARELTLVFLSNLRSAANWQLRAQLKNLLVGRATAAIHDPPAVASAFEAPDSVTGLYGDPADPVAVVAADGKLFRDENEFYPIGGGWYYIPASGSVMRFRRGATGAVDAIETRWGDGRETTMPRLPSH